ncbi:hypothetical protein [Streptomyces griseosporeus]|uniref:hypothetical protein n=1 Tax=Streptomyces griseosporeus TaxID=1910 RepID=UPI0036F9A2E0
MATAEVPGIGAVRRLTASLAVVLAAVCAACGTAADGSQAATGSPPATASASPESPEALCTRVVAHWSREVLDGDTYGDYQSMGLSNGQYEILRSVVDAARAAKKHQGAAAAEELIDRRAHEGCVAWYRSGGPGEGPWQ